MITLVRNPDILHELVERRNSSGSAEGEQLIVGFAAETGHSHGDAARPTRRQSSQRKGCDLLVVNHVGADKLFGSQDTNSVVILARSGSLNHRRRPGTKT